MGRKRSAGDAPELAAGNGLLDRRALLAAGASLGGAGVIAARPAFGAAELSVEPWMTEPGSPFTGYGQPSRFEAKVVRTFASAPGTTGTGASRTPLQRLNGTITPNGLHFERHHSGIPDIDPDAHRLLIHGLVKRPLVFTLEALARYPMETRIAFIECGGNTGALYQKEPAQLDLQASHGLLSCAEWTGVRLALLLEEAGVEPQAQWLLAEGADAAGMSRSVPMKAVDEALVALYQNGERVRPSNGYPLRLLLPGYEGNMNVKWLRRIKVTAGPTMTKDETSKYTILLPSGKSLQFVFPIETKSVITHPSPGLTLKGCRPLRDFGPRLVGLRQDQPGRGLGRRRKKLGSGGAAGAGVAKGADPVPHTVALGRRPGGAAEPRDGRFRVCPADACRVDRRTRHQDVLSLQRHHQLGDRRARGGPACLCLGI